MKNKKFLISDLTILKNLCVLPKESIKDAISTINKSALQLAIITNAKNKYLGLITDGDVRRGLIKNISINAKVTKILNKKSFFVSQAASRQKVEQIMFRKKINHLPILNKKKVLIGLHLKEGIITSQHLKNPVIIMAGGYGKRLRPFTLKTPKPMIQIKGKPMLEHIILKFKKESFKNFYLSVFYLKNKIKKYFKDGKFLNVNIKYIEENKPLGTAGSLKFFKKKFNLPLIVCNGDVLSNISLQNLLKFHKKNNSFATMAVIKYSHQTPYGVVNAKGFNFSSIKEKPIKEYYVSAGVYCLNPKAIDFIPSNKKVDIPDLFKIIKKNRKKTIIFPVHENWNDVGRLEDLNHQKKYF